MIQSNNKRFDKLFNKWLWSDEKTRKSYNPFTKFMAEIGRKLPEVELPEVNQKKYGKI